MIALEPLTVSAIRRLPPHSRHCAFWETTDAPADADAGFVKEEWISRVLLEWGVCGLLAVADGDTIGSAMYAPPRLVPRADEFESGPVSPDAVLLTTLEGGELSPVADGDRSGAEAFAAAELGSSSTDARTDLLAGVVADLRGRGVRAVETFGWTRDPENVADSGACGTRRCMTSTGFLLDHGFEIEQEHECYPRLRLEIEADHLWKADVEHALDSLVTIAAIRRVAVHS